MTLTPFFHVGFLVRELDEGMGRFGPAFGVTWTDPIAHAVTLWEAGQGDAQLSPRIVYSREGPPHLELIEAIGDGIYSASRGEGVHHVGAWHPDCERRQTELHEQAIEPVATQFTHDRRIVVSYFDPVALHGVMLEIVDEARRPLMERWFAGAPYEKGR